MSKQTTKMDSKRILEWCKYQKSGMLAMSAYGIVLADISAYNLALDKYMAAKRRL